MNHHGRIPPHDAAAEATVLSAMIMIPQCIDEVREHCDDTAFYAEANKIIFRVLTGLHDAGEAIDLVRVASVLRSNGDLAKVGGTPYLAQITDATPAVVNVVDHARICQDFGRVRRGIAALTKAAALGYGDLGDDKHEHDQHERVQSWLNSILSDISDVAHERQTNRLQPIDQSLREVFQVVRAAKESGSKVTGVPTGFTLLDKQMTGLHDGDVTIVASRPGMGKTSLALSMAKKQAEQGYATPVFSLEMPRLQIAMRLLSQEANVDMSELRSGRFPDQKWGDITGAIERLCELPIYIDDQPAITTHEIRSRVRLLQRLIELDKVPKATKGRVGTVYIDYLQLMGSGLKRASREEQVADNSKSLKRIAKELSVPLCVLSQLNRDPEKRKDQRPLLSDLRESGAIEQDADNVIFVFRESYYDQDDLELRGKADLIVAKQRNGPTGTKTVAFVPETARFENLADDDPPGAYDGREFIRDVADSLAEGMQDGFEE